MDWNYIYYFKRVAELEHVSKAAEELYISQPQLSRVISELERFFGAKFFIRSGTGIKLTNSGRIFYQHVLKMIGFIEETKRQVRLVDQSNTEQISVVTNAGAYMPGLLLLLAQSAPQLKIKQYSAPRSTLLSMLRRGGADFALCCPPIQELDFQSVVMLEEVPIVIYPEGHWLESRTQVTLTDLKEEPFISVAQGYGARDSVANTYESLGLYPNFVIETGDTSSVQRYVRAGMGIAISPKSLIMQDDYFKNHFIEIKEKMLSSVAMTWKKDRVFNENDNVLFDTAVNYFKTLGLELL